MGATDDVTDRIGTTRVLVIEDERSIATAIADGLRTFSPRARRSGMPGAAGSPDGPYGWLTSRSTAPRGRVWRAQSEAR